MDYYDKSGKLVKTITLAVFLLFAFSIVSMASYILFFIPRGTSDSIGYEGVISDRKTHSNGEYTYIIEEYEDDE